MLDRILSRAAMEELSRPMVGHNGSGTGAAASDGVPEASRPKRARLSLACNQCRKRKVRCDAEMPKCSNCRLRGQVCETTDPRNPELVVYRKESKRVDEHSIDSEDNTRMPRLTSIVSGVDVLSPLASRLGNTPPTYSSEKPTMQRANHETQVSSPVQHNNSHDTQPTPEGTINRDGSKHRRKLMGRSSLQSLAMVLDLYLTQADLPRVAPCFRHGMRYVEEFMLPLNYEIPDLPPPSLIESFFTTVQRRVIPMFPVVDIQYLREEINRLMSSADQSWGPSDRSGHLKKSLQAQDIPVAACIFATISLGADEAAGGISETGTLFLNAAYSLYAHLVGMPYVLSVQALLLITIALRGRSKEGQGFHTLGQAIRIAHSIGLHRHPSVAGTQSPGKTGSDAGSAALHARIWWACYALERTFELETARPSAVRRSDCDQVISRASEDEFPYFAHFVSLAMILGQISDALYRIKRGLEVASHMIQTIASLDNALAKWCSSIPEYIRPGVHLLCDVEEYPFAALLSLQYHQAVITLHRTALVVSPQQYAAEIDKVQAANPGSSWHRVKKGSELCIGSARAIVKLDSELADHGIKSTLFTITQTLLASVVLALNIIRHPTSRMASSDLEMLTNEVQLAEEQYQAVGQDDKFIEVCSTLKQSVWDFVQHQRQTHAVAAGYSSNSTHRQQLTPASSHASNANVPDVSWDYPGIMQHDVYEHMDLLHNVALEDYWALLGPDFGVDIASPDQMSI